MNVGQFFQQFIQENNFNQEKNHSDIWESMAIFFLNELGLTKTIKIYQTIYGPFLSYFL